MRPRPRRGNEGPLRFSAFVDVGHTKLTLSTDEGRRLALDQFRASNVSKVYLDCLRGGDSPSEETLTVASDFFRHHGIDVAAGLTPTRGTGKGCTHGRWWLCYTNEATRTELEEVVRRTARLFDDIIVDDFLCTHCRCEECREAMGPRTSGQYRRDLLVEVAERHIVGPIREENPDAHVTIKYPQWYDRFHVFGYDVSHHPSLFDEVWVGTEIRDPLIEYVHQYQGFANYQWLASLAGERIGGAWFDFINCYPEIYVEQAVQSILAGARELIRFHYDPDLFSPESPCTSALIAAIPTLERLAEELDGREPRGVVLYKPKDSDGQDETYLPDYLGMLGMPVVPRADIPEAAEAVCFSAHATADPDAPVHALALAERGGTLLLTPGFLDACADDSRILALAGYGTPPVTPTDRWTFRFGVAGEAASSERHVRLQANLHPVSAEVLAWGVYPSGNVPVLTRRRVGHATTLVLNAKTFEYPEGSGRVTVGEPVSLPHLPQELVDVLRAELMSAMPLDVQVRSRVGVYLYGDTLVLANFNDQSARAVVSTPGRPDSPQADQVTATTLGDWANGQLTLEVPRRSFRVVTRNR